VIRRKLTFSAWQSALTTRNFDRVAAAREITALPQTDAVLEHDDAMTSVVVIDAGPTPSRRCSRARVAVR
jgi:hypothetical protein